MTADRDEIRDHLSAVIEAARELPKDDRVFLADTFLDDLEKHYQLLPRSRGGGQPVRKPRQSPFTGFTSARSPFPIGLMILLAVVLVPVVMMTFAVFAHPPVLLLAVLLLLLFRSGFRRGPRHRRFRRSMFV